MGFKGLPMGLQGPRHSQGGPRTHHAERWVHPQPKHPHTPHATTLSGYHTQLGALPPPPCAQSWCQEPPSQWLFDLRQCPGVGGECGQPMTLRPQNWLFPPSPSFCVLGGSLLSLPVPPNPRGASAWLGWSLGQQEGGGGRTPWLL